MTLSRIIVQRSRACKLSCRSRRTFNPTFNPTTSCTSTAVRWICIPSTGSSSSITREIKGGNDEYCRNDDNLLSLNLILHNRPIHFQQQQRRYLTIGRRHGWKGDDDDKNKKKNFAKEFLEPAAKGELKEKHSSGIPKLAVRKHKGHGLRASDDDDLSDTDRELDELATQTFQESDGYRFGGGKQQPPGYDDYEIEGGGATSSGDNLYGRIQKDIIRANSERMSSTTAGRFQAGGRGGGGPGDGRGLPGTVRVNGEDNRLVALPPPDGEKRGVYTMSFDNGRRNDYWREEDYDDELLTDEHRAFVRELVGLDSNPVGTDVPLSEIASNEIDFSDFDYDSLDVDASDGEDEDGDKKSADDKMSATDKDTNNDEMKAGDRGGDDDVDDLEGAVSDDEGFNKYGQEEKGGMPMKTQFNAISPLQISGPTAEDFWNDLKNHPTMYAEVRHYNEHPESKREPKPYFPKNRAYPDPEIVEFYMRWLYVTGLPPALSGEGMKHGTKSKLNVRQEQEIQNVVTRLLNVSFDQVFPADETSAFVGFESPVSREDVIKKSLIEKTLTRPVTISAYTHDPEDDNYGFIKGVSSDTIVMLENVPPGKFSRDILARDLFPQGSELGAAYPLTRDQVVFRSPTTALIRFDSAEQASSALSSKSVTARLEELGEYPVRLFRAKRELKHKCMRGPLKNEEVRELGPRIIVDGDMPSRNFYISHASVIMLQNLDVASVSKESITEFFQPFSHLLRDEKGSIEFVTCENGLPTDRAYVGFDRLGEAEAVMKTFKNGRARIRDNMVTLKLLKDRSIPGTPPRISRPERTEEEILKSLDDWEQYVDPEDIKYLEKHGVAKVVIDEALRGMRFQNRSFGSLDWAMRDEKLEPEKESGDDYKELVQLYISTLKECVATPEDPGDMYEAMHFPGEPIDLSIFEREKKRQKMLMKKRGL